MTESLWFAAKVIASIFGLGVFGFVLALCTRE